MICERVLMTRRLGQPTVPELWAVSVEVGKMRTQSQECSVCHATSADRVISDASETWTPMCFECLWSWTEAARRGILKWTGIPFYEDAAALSPDATESEIRLAWERFDACLEMFQFLGCALQSAMGGRDSFTLQWTGGRVDEPTTMSDEKLLRLRAFMATQGYDEVACETVPTKANLQMPEGPPHWCTSVEFEKAS